MWRRILALVIKEFLALLQDPTSRVVIIVPPLMQLVIFGYAATFDLTQIPFALYDEDRSAASRELAARFLGSDNFRLVETLDHDDQIAPLVNSKRVLLVLHMGRTFTRDLLSGRTAHVQAILDGRDSNTALVALGYVQGIVSRYSASWLEEHGRAGPPAQLATRAWFNPNLESRWFIVPGIVGLLTLVVTILVTALSVAREREHGTFDQLLVTPFRPVEILIGKSLPGFLIGTFEATLIIVVAVLWFRIPLVGNLLVLYTGIGLFLVSAVGVGLMISSLAVTQQQGLLGAFLFIAPSVILSGFATPIANMPLWIQKITYVNPLRYFMVILRGVFLEGTPFNLLIDQFWPMALIGLVNLSFAAWLFRRRMY